MPDYNKQFKLYKPNRDGTGSATSWELTYKPGEKPTFMMFLTAAKQNGTNPEGNAVFDWKNAMIVKLGEIDIGELIATLEGRKDQVGTKGSLFHQTNAGNKVVNFSSNENGYFLSVSAQDANKNSVGKISQLVTHAEAAILLVLLRLSLERIYGW